MGWHGRKDWGTTGARVGEGEQGRTEVGGGQQAPGGPGGRGARAEARPRGVSRDTESLTFRAGSPWVHADPVT